MTRECKTPRDGDRCTDCLLHDLDVAWEKFLASAIKLESSFDLAAAVGIPIADVVDETQLRAALGTAGETDGGEG